MKTITLVFCFGLLTSIVFAQPDTLWTRVYGGPEFDRSLGRALPLEDGGFFVTGYTESFGAGFRDIWLLRLDENGDTLWTRTYGGEDEDVGNTILPATGGGYWLSGRTMSYGAGGRDWMLMKISENGDSLWSRTFGGTGGDWGGRSYPTSDGGLFMAGQWADDSLGAQMGIIKLDANGDSLWGRSFGGPGHEVCTDAFQTENGGYILAGTTESYAVGERDYWLVKLDANGDSIWSHSYGGEFMENCNAVQPTDDGGYMLGGTTRSFGVGAADMWIVKTSAAGDSLWSRTFGGTADDDSRDLCRARDGGFVLAGFSREFDGGQSVFLRVNANGDSLWSLLNGSVEDDDRNYWIEALSDGSYFAGGLRLNHPEENDDFWLVRTGRDPIQNPPGEFMRVIPEDSSFVQWPLDTFAWTRSVDLDGDEVTYMFHLESNMSGYESFDVSTTDTMLMFDWTQLSSALDEVFEFHWTVHATDGVDTVEASNGQGIYFFDTPEPPEPFWRVAPEDSVALVWLPWEETIEFIWTSSSDPNSDSVAYVFHLESPTNGCGFFPEDTVTHDTMVTVTVMVYDAPLDEINEFYWTVRAASNYDTVEASNGEGYFTMDIPGAADETVKLPTEFGLNAYPNPFNPSTTIRYSLPQAGEVKLVLYDITGREIKQLLNEHHPSGSFDIAVDGAELPSGIMFVRLTAGTQVKTKKIVLLK